MKKTGPPNDIDKKTSRKEHADDFSSSHTESAPDIDLSLHGMDSQYEVEEEFLQRSNYENTTIFMMEVEKAKARATTMQHPFPAEHAQEQREEHHTSNDTEKMSIRQTLENLRIAEEKERKEFEKSVRRQTGLLGSLKRIFSKD